jgi:hypothetical protein
MVNGVQAPAPTSLSTHTKVQAVFSRAVTVNNFTDVTGSASTPGTLRYALTNAGDGDIITFSGVTPGTTSILLERILPEITESLTIEGAGVTLISDFYTWGILNISSSTATVTIRRVHFKDGDASGGGGAVQNSGILTLESCIFNHNQATGTYGTGNGGGAVYSNNTLTLRGCTFYANSTMSSGGAVYFRASGKTLTLTGNLFYGNGAASYSVVYVGNGTVSASYNVAGHDLGTGSAQAGWTAGTGDTTLSALGFTNPFSTTNTTPLPFVPVSGLQNLLPSTAPTGFPITDFYGATRNTSVPGAVNYAP